ncbi:predicted protein [Postia placenta Mad-698-R]|nr:predicted protein [Postia placenta Mad-698-R]
MNEQLPIQSQFLAKLEHNLHPAIVLGTNQTETRRFNGLTTLIFGHDYLEDDSSLVQKRADIVHTAAVFLEKCYLVKYTRRDGSRDKNWSWENYSSVYPVEEPAAKINVLQGFISQLKSKGFALVADMVYVQQSAGR